MRNPVLSVAVASGKASSFAARLFGRGGGTALPGLIAQAVYPGVLRALSAQLTDGAIAVTGTNGKTTTTRMIGAILEASGIEPLHNRSGSNLERGLVSSLVTAATPLGTISKRAGLFEIDEAAFPVVLPSVRPRVALFTNLFRDQLDRYGELDSIHSKWRATIPSLPPTTSIVLNADDPAIAALAIVPGLRAKPLLFGIEDESYALESLPHAADSISCPRCNNRLTYTLILLGHLGHWRCSACGLARPRPDILARRVVLNGTESSRVDIETPLGNLTLVVRVPGLYNVYNALAAVAAALAFGIDLSTIKRGIESFAAAFGRIERVSVPATGKDLLLALVKNPVGFNEVLRMLFPKNNIETGDDPKSLLIIINDLTADGRDVSWLWDVDFELLVEPGPVDTVWVSGLRAADMAVRLKYAGVDGQKFAVTESMGEALDAALAGLGDGATLYVLPTYTAMLDFRKMLFERGWVSNRFWEQ